MLRQRQGHLGASAWESFPKMETTFYIVTLDNFTVLKIPPRPTKQSKK